MSEHDWPAYAGMREVVAALLDQKPEIRAHLKGSEIPEDRLLIQMHHGLGKWLRNNLGLWAESEPESRLKMVMEGLGFQHADDMSTEIMRLMIREIRGEDYTTEELHRRIEEYAEYWKKKEQGDGEEGGGED